MTLRTLAPDPNRRGAHPQATCRFPLCRGSDCCDSRTARRRHSGHPLRESTIGGVLGCSELRRLRFLMSFRRGLLGPRLAVVAQSELGLLNVPCSHASGTGTSARLLLNWCGVAVLSGVRGAVLLPLAGRQNERQIRYHRPHSRGRFPHRAGWRQSSIAATHERDLPPSPR